MANYSLFNAADECLAHEVGIDDFEQSLLLNILFQQNILLHESYVFDSSLLAKHVKRAQQKGQSSLFECAAREGFIAPVLRFKDAQCMQDVYQKLMKVYGEDYQLLRPEVKPVIDLMTAAMDVGLSRTGPKYWPSDKNLGEGFLTTVREMLQTDGPPEYILTNTPRGFHIGNIWEQSGQWRFDCVEEALKRTRGKGQKGLQRAELFNVIGWSVGISKANKSVIPQDILQLVTEPQKRLALEVCLKWFTQCHHLNQARMLEASTNFPVYNLDEDFLVDTLLRSPLDEAPESFEGFRCQVELPSTASLLQTKANELISIRRDLGLAYLNALQRWEESPTEANQQTVAELLQQYCKAICNRYQDVNRSLAFATIAKRSALPVATALIGAIKAFAAPHDRSGAVLHMDTEQFLQLLQTVFVLITLIPGHAGPAPGTRELEVTLPSRAQYSDGSRPPSPLAA